MRFHCTFVPASGITSVVVLREEQLDTEAHLAGLGLLDEHLDDGLRRVVLGERHAVRPGDLANARQGLPVGVPGAHGVLGTVQQQLLVVVVVQLLAVEAERLAELVEQGSAVDAGTLVEGDDHPSDVVLESLARLGGNLRSVLESLAERLVVGRSRGLEVLDLLPSVLERLANGTHRDGSEQVGDHDLERLLQLGEPSPEVAVRPQHELVVVLDDVVRVLVARERVENLAHHREDPRVLGESGLEEVHGLSRRIDAVAVELHQVLPQRGLIRGFDGRVGTAARESPGGRLLRTVVAVGESTVAHRVQELLGQVARGENAVTGGVVELVAQEGDGLVEESQRFLLGGVRRVRTDGVVDVLSENAHDELSLC